MPPWPTTSTTRKPWTPLSLKNRSSDSRQNGVNDHPNFPQGDHLKIPLSSGCFSPVSPSSPGLWDLWAAPLLAPSKELWETPLLAFSIAPSGSIGHALLFRGWGAAPGFPAPYTARYASAAPP